MKRRAVETSFTRCQNGSHTFVRFGRPSEQSLSLPLFLKVGFGPFSSESRRKPPRVLVASREPACEATDNSYRTGSDSDRIPRFNLEECAACRFIHIHVECWHPVATARGSVPLAIFAHPFPRTVDRLMR